MSGNAPRSARAGQEQLLERLLAALLAADQIAAQGVIEEALRTGWSVDDTRFELITPALHRVGDRWERGEIGVGHEHLATSVCEWLLITMTGRSPHRPPSGRRVVVGCSEGERHALGARIVANVLAEAGWTVLHLGASTPVDAWEPIVRTRRPDAVVITTTMRDGLPRAQATVRAIRATRADCVLAIGGQAYAGIPDAARQFGADVAGIGVQELPGRLEALCAGLRPRPGRAPGAERG